MDETFDFLKSSAVFVRSGTTNSYETKLSSTTGEKIINAYFVLFSPACRTVLNALKKLASKKIARKPTTAARYIKLLILYGSVANE